LGAPPIHPRVRQRMRAVISVKGAWAELYGPPGETLDGVLRVLDPRCEQSLAYREKRWDGYVRLYEGNRFPAGFVSRVTEYLQSTNHDVVISSPQETKQIDTSRMGPKYLGGVGPNRKHALWEHQLRAIMAMLENSRGIVKSPTGSGKTEVVAAVARYLWEERGWRSVIVVPRKGLAAQTVQRLQLYYGNDLTVGQCGDGKRIIGDVTVATAQTLIHFQPTLRNGKVCNADPELRDLVHSAEVLFLDEAHHASAESWYTIAMESRAIRKFGLSGTPLKDDVIADMRLIGATGEIICHIESTDLIAKGLNAQPKIVVVYSPKVSGPELPVVNKVRIVQGEHVPYRQYLPWDKAYIRGIVKNPHHNAAVVRAVEWLVDRGRRTLVLCRRKAHWLDLKARIEETGIPCAALWGPTSMYDREDAKREIKNGSVKVILATTIFDEGEDVPAVEGLVLAEGVKVSVNALQRVGRGMRRKKGSNDVWVVDFCPTCHPRLSEHALQRVLAYEGEGYPVMVWEHWPDPDSGEDLLPFSSWDLTAAKS